MDRVHVAVVGGGIGGLALAIALIRRGFRCTVFEKDPSFEFRRQVLHMLFHSTVRVQPAPILFSTQMTLAPPRTSRALASRSSKGAPP